MKLKYTRAILNAIHSGELRDAPTTVDPLFGFAVPTVCAGVPDSLLDPRSTWSNPSAYDTTARKLAHLFVENFATYADGTSDAVRAAGPAL